MAKQTKLKKAENLGKGNVTPIQVAFIVDRYLFDNNYTQTRSIFRTEASTLISKTQVREAPKSLLSLGAILDEYICLKEQRVMLDQEKSRLEQEKCRVETLLQGMQGVMHAYNNSAGTISTPSHSVPATNSMALIPQPDPSNGSLAGNSMNSSHITNSVPRLPSTIKDPANFTTPITDLSTKNKRKSSRLVPNAPPIAKKSCNQLPTKPLSIGGTNTPIQATNSNSAQETVQRFSAIQSPHNCLPNGSSTQGSSVAKSLFKQPSLSPQTNLTGPKTPPQSFPSPADQSVSPPESSLLVNSTSNHTSPEMTPRKCPVISTEKATLSPFKHVTYYSMERSHYISSPSPIKANLKRLGKRDQVKGRLDFDGSDMPMSSGQPLTSEIPTSGSYEESNIFDMDFPNFDVFGSDFSLSELLVDIDFDCDGIDFSCQQALGPTTNSISGSPHDLGDQVLSEVSSTVTEVLSEKDMNINGLDTLTSVKSVTKCTRILSPVKHCSTLMDQENLSAK